MEEAPSLENFLAGVFTAKARKDKSRFDLSEDTLTPSQFVDAIVNDLNIQPPLDASDLLHLRQEADKNHDGKLDWEEFSATITPLLSALFMKQADHSDWVALEDKHSDRSGKGETFLYFYNRSTGEPIFEAEKVDEVMSWFDKKSGDDKDLIFMGDTNIPNFKNGTTPFQNLIDHGYKRAFDPSDISSNSSLSNS